MAEWTQAVNAPHMWCGPTGVDGPLHCNVGNAADCRVCQGWQAEFDRRDRARAQREGRLF